MNFLRGPWEMLHGRTVTLWSYSLPSQASLTVLPHFWSIGHKCSVTFDVHNLSKKRAGNGYSRVAEYLLDMLKALGSAQSPGSRSQHCKRQQTAALMEKKKKKKRWAGDLRRPQRAHENDPEKWVIWCGRSRPVSQTVIQLSHSLGLLPWQLLLLLLG